MVVFLWCFLTMLWPLCQGKVRLATVGRHFVLSLPKMSQTEASQLVFYLATQQDTEFKVTMTTEWFTQGDKLNVELTLKKMKLTSYIPDKKYYHQQVSGHKWTYRFTAYSDFSITVLMQESADSVATFIALPITSWGNTYYAVTLEVTPFIEIVTGAYPVLVKVALRIKANFDHVNLKVTYEGVQYFNGQSMNIKLKRFEAFEISECVRPNNHGNLSGTKITAQRPVGVISGSCTSLQSAAHRKCSYPKSKELTTEMIIPEDLHEKNVLLPVHPERKSGALLVVIISAEKSRISYPNQFGFPESAELIASMQPYHNEHLVLLNSESPMQAYIVEFSSCSPESPKSGDYELGDPSLSLVIPTSLYSSEYLVCTPQVTSARHYVIMVTKRDDVRTLQVDGKDIPPTTNFSLVRKTEDDVVGSVQIEAGIHIVLSTAGHHFGCYVYGHGHRFSYMHPAGFAFKPISQVCRVLNETMSPGDEIDNDCDGEADEEILDKKDNDGDNKIDEDLKNEAAPTRKPKPTKPDGADLKDHWTNWSYWKCTQNCTDERLYRERQCYDLYFTKKFSCPGLSIEFKPGICFMKQPCPTECPDFFWGEGCKLLCQHCIEPCNKFDGSCMVCKPGYKDSEAGCRYPCDAYKYGPNCTGDCWERCDTDCFDRVTGECPRPGWLLLILLTSTIVTTPCCYLCMRNRDKKPKSAGEESSLNIEEYNSYNSDF